MAKNHLIIWKFLVKKLCDNYMMSDSGAHCVKSVHTRSFSGPYFPTFGLNPERYGVSLHTQSKYLSVFSPNAGKHGTEKL